MSPHTAFVPTTLPATGLTTTLSPVVLSPSLPTTSFILQAAPLRRAQISTVPPSAPSPARTPSRVLLWFHSDLRVTDNPALRAAASAAAAPGGILVPVAAGAACDASTAPLLAELKAALNGLGSDLLVAPGRVEKTLLRICRNLKLGAVYFNRSVLRGRVQTERRVVDALSRAGVHVEAFWGNILCAPSDEMLRSERGKETGLREMAKLLKEAAEMPVAAPDSLPAVPAEALRMSGMRSVAAKVGSGTTKAVEALQRMSVEDETLLLSEMPDLAVAVKVFLDYGALSAKMVVQRVVQVMGSAKGRTFSELVWREYVCVASHRAVGLTSAATCVSA